jgi:hypothetical protein
MSANEMAEATHGRMDLEMTDFILLRVALKSTCAKINSQSQEGMIPWRARVFRWLVS